MKWLTWLPGRFLSQIIISLLLLSCESEVEKYNRLNEEYQGLRAQIEDMERGCERLRKEQEKSWQCTATERFAYLYPIEYPLPEDKDKYKWHKLPDEGYIREIGIQQSDKNKYRYNLEVRVRSRTDAKIHFVIYFYDEQGLIVDKEPGWLSKDNYMEEEHTWWGIKAGKEKIYKGSISCAREPKYFRIDRIR